MMAVIRTHPGLVAVVASLLACATLAMPACRRETRSAPAGSRYPLRGTVVSVDAPNRSLVVAHEEIPGFMEAMTMEFVVLEKDQALLAGVAPGDGIAATLVVPDSRYWLEELKVTRRGSAQHTPTRRSAEARLGEAGKPERLTKAVARYYAKLLAIKDEWEVARLYTDGRFEAALKNQFEDWERLSFHMAPPLLARKGLSPSGK